MENVFCKLLLTKKFTHQIHNFLICGNVEKSATLHTSSTGQQDASKLNGSRKKAGKKRQRFFPRRHVLENLRFQAAFKTRKIRVTTFLMLKSVVTRLKAELCQITIRGHF